MTANRLFARSSPIRRRLRLLAAIAFALVLVACESVLNVRGYVPDEEALAKIVPQRTNRTEVRATLGTPSTVSTFDDKVWYYMSEKTETLAFFDPTLLERRIVAIVFGGNDTVEDVVTYSEADGREIEIVSRTTPTAGNEVTLLQQLFGNLGRFSEQK
jgi:outer membrane protein assembly factor BamE (lipoprotein component of BamABCDE complex)